MIGHFQGVRGQHAARIIEGQGDFGDAQAAPEVVPLKMTSAISPPRSALGTLLPEHPADRVDDVAFPAAIGTDNSGDSGGKIELCFVGETFETD